MAETLTEGVPMISAKLKEPNRGAMVWLRGCQDAVAGPRAAMVEPGPRAIQGDLTTAIAAELAAAGFSDAQEIGRGGFGAVYRCWQRALERPVAIKVLTTDLDADNVERFLREQRAMGKLCGHPNIVKIFQVGVTKSGRPYIVMQYHPRNSLDARIHHGGPLGWQETLHIGIKMAGALETAHRLGTLHRDVKPANILLSDYGQPEMTRLGIARITRGVPTQTGVVTVSPAFTAPEVLQGQTPTPASDVYSLGATLFCALTGHAAFERRSGEAVVAQFLRITRAPVPELQGIDIPDDVRTTIGHAMAPSSDDRPATAAELGEELREAQRRNDLTVDDMAIPSDVAEVFHAEHRAAAAQHPSPVRVVVAEDDVLFRAGLASLLDRSGFTVVGQAGDGAQLLAVVRETTPELVITDIRMPPTHTTEGLDAARTIRDAFPEIG